MPIPAGTSRLVLSGTLPGGEIWASGFASDYHAASQDEANTFANSVFGIWKDTTSGKVGNLMQSHWMGTTTTMDRCTIYSYSDTTGKASIIGVSNSPGITGTSTSKNVDPTAVVVTLLTHYAGASHRGRMYLPATGANIGTDGLFVAPDPGNLCAAVAVALKASAAALGAFFPVVVSRHLGTYATVYSCQVDQRPDSQRRRANRQNRGTRSTTTITYP
jgi:hypothetical protein